MRKLRKRGDGASYKHRQMMMAKQYEVVHTLPSNLLQTGGNFETLGMLSMNWKYLDAVHRDTGFSEAWCDHIHNCLSSVSYSMMISGESFEKFYRSNGLRQGDPLSPYLFILGLEGLPCMLNKAESKGLQMMYSFFSRPMLINSECSKVFFGLSLSLRSIYKF